jgi:hypothetical protein
MHGRLLSLLSLRMGPLFRGPSSMLAGGGRASRVVSPKG